MLVKLLVSCSGGDCLQTLEYWGTAYIEEKPAYMDTPASPEIVFSPPPIGEGWTTRHGDCHFCPSCSKDPLQRRYK